MNDIYESIDECNTKKIKLLIVFNDKIAGTLSNKKLHSVVTVSYIKQKKKKKKKLLYILSLSHHFILLYEKILG